MPKCLRNISCQKFDQEDYLHLCKTDLSIIIKYKYDTTIFFCYLGSSSEWGCASDASQRAMYSLDLIVTSTAQTFCVGFMSIKDSKSRFLLLEMPDVERVGKASVTQEFHIDL